MDIQIFKETYINGECVNAVDGRKLWSFLEVTTRFNDWIERRITEYGFTVNSDYSKTSTRLPSGGFFKNDYFVTIDMAKELSMVEKTAKGKEARKYFIECEKKAKGIAHVQDTPEIVMAKAIKFAEAKIKMLEHVVTKTAPAVDFRNYATKKGTQWTITDAKNQLEISLARLQEQLVMVNFFRVKKMERNNRLWPKDKYIDCGYCVDVQDGPNYAFTCKGMEFLKTLVYEGAVKAENLFEIDRQPDLSEG